MFVGAALFVRGLLFLQDTSALLEYIQRTGSWVIPTILEHYVVLAHLGGGSLLMLGLLTRVGALIQLPALIGAVFFVHFGDGLLSHGQDLELSTLVLVSLCMFAATGTGTVGLDAVIERQESGSRQHRNTRLNVAS